MNGVTDWWTDVNTSCIRKPQVISEGGWGGGVRTPCTPPRSAPDGPEWVMFRGIIVPKNVFAMLTGLNHAKNSRSLLLQGLICGLWTEKMAIAKSGRNMRNMFASQWHKVLGKKFLILPKEV